MNTVNLSSLKMLTCAIAAVTLTLGASVAFLESTAVVRMAGVPTPMVADTATTHLAQAGTTGLLQ